GNAVAVERQALRMERDGDQERTGRRFDLRLLFCRLDRLARRLVVIGAVGGSFRGVGAFRGGGALRGVRAPTRVIGGVSKQRLKQLRIRGIGSRQHGGAEACGQNPAPSVRADVVSPTGCMTTDGTDQPILPKSVQRLIAESSANSSG